MFYSLRLKDLLCRLWCRCLYLLASPSEIHGCLLHRLSSFALEGVYRFQLSPPLFVLLNNFARVLVDLPHALKCLFLFRLVLRELQRLQAHADAVHGAVLLREEVDDRDLLLGRDSFVPL